MPFLSGSITQGGADAFVADQINTGLSGIANQALRILRVELEFPGGPLQPFSTAAAPQDVSFAITRKAKAAMPTLTDSQLMLKMRRAYQLQTAVGFGMMGDSSIMSWDAPNPDAEKLDDGALLAIEDPLSVCLDSTGTGLTLTGYFRIEYDTVRISTEERIRLLELTLS